jgi:pimeloyl-ACP methyl ester carboxylesterase
MICQIKMRLRRPVQQDIPFRTHGGKRAGAGRPKDMARSLVSHARRPEVAGTTPVHVTLRVRPEVLNLRSGRSFRLIEKALVALRAARDARVVHYSVQGNHVHLVMEADDRRALGRRVQGLEIRIARAMNRLMGRKRGTVFADRYHARALRTPLEVKRALEYVLKNRRHHTLARGRRRSTRTRRPIVSTDGAGSSRPSIARVRCWSGVHAVGCCGSGGGGTGSSRSDDALRGNPRGGCCASAFRRHPALLLWTRLEDLLATTCPALVVRGRDSRVTTDEHLREMATRRHNTELVTLAAGHVAHQEAPEEFARVVQQFLSKL